jgi:hypothetical protein
VYQGGVDSLMYHDAKSKKLQVYKLNLNFIISGDIDINYLIEMDKKITAK